jgi:hypothetical protein
VTSSVRIRHANLTGGAGPPAGSGAKCARRLSSPDTVRGMGRRGCALAGSCVLAAFVGIERRLREGPAARSLDAGEEDKGTTRAVGASFGLATMAGPLSVQWRRGRLPTPLGWVGVAIMAAGLGLRVSAARTLGSHYTRTLRTEGDQPVVTGGPIKSCATLAMRVFSPCGSVMGSR